MNCELSYSSIDMLSADMVQLLRRRKLTISTAESLTGGMLSSSIVGVSGASDVFSLGCCTYSDAMKSQILGVNPKILTEFTAVSAPVAVQMAEGVRRVSHSDIGVSTTGYADGEQGGLVFIAVSFRENTESKRCVFSGDRHAVRELAVKTALELAIKILKKSINY